MLGSNGSDILSVAIGIVLVYLMLSLGASAVNEIIAGRLRWRAKSLEAAIMKLLNDDITQLGKWLYNHPLVQSLNLNKGPGESYSLASVSSANPPNMAENNKSKPSYIPKATFSRALVDTLLKLDAAVEAQPGAQPGAQPADAELLATLRAKIAALPDSDAKKALQTLVNSTVVTSIEGARRAIEGWFDDTMERASSLYQMRTKTWLLIIGAIIALAINADSIMIGKILWQDGAMRAALVAAADRYATLPPTETGVALISRIKQDTNQLNLPLGWSFRLDSQDIRALPSQDADALRWLKFVLTKVIGIAATALAVSLGAPFWFDVLNKFMKFRSTFKPPEEAGAGVAKG